MGQNLRHPYIRNALTHATPKQHKHARHPHLVATCPIILVGPCKTIPLIHSVDALTLFSAIKDLFLVWLRSFIESCTSLVTFCNGLNPEKILDL